MTDRMLGLGFAALGLVILVLSLQLPAPIAATRIDYGPGFFPTILGVVIALSGLAMVVFKPEPVDPQDEEEPSDKNYLRPAFVLVAALVYIFFSQQIGFLLLAPPILFSLLMVGRAALVPSVLISIIGSIVVYFLFAKLLLVPLPLGLLTPLGGYL
ncbi:tripartite tricarboxylate transporter TctB family protein [Devosia chinhatensis]|uniref:tripartite tricarboxylate transporter TctB family protein n=1 Tax=Devosia chinhatensis TaxID=429727 RepID=UPI000A064777|nr:tripartite tricarboxylate transporter TctB family protein [Devosia chinhatensis]